METGRSNFDCDEYWYPSTLRKGILLLCSLLASFMNASHIYTLNNTYVDGCHLGGIQKKTEQGTSIDYCCVLEARTTYPIICVINYQVPVFNRPIWWIDL